MYYLCSQINTSYGKELSVNHFRNNISQQIVSEKTAMEAENIIKVNQK